MKPLSELIPEILKKIPGVKIEFYVENYNMQLAVDFKTTINAQEFAVYAEGNVQREFYNDPLTGEINSLRVFYQEIEVTDNMTPELTRIVRELTLDHLFNQYRDEFGMREAAGTDHG